MTFNVVFIFILLINQLHTSCFPILLNVQLIVVVFFFYYVSYQFQFFDNFAFTLTKQDYCFIIIFPYVAHIFTIVFVHFVSNMSNLHINI